MASVYYTLALFLLATAGSAKNIQNPVCQTEDVCKCTTMNGDVIDLSPLTDSGPFEAKRGTKETYYYNPCKTFTKGSCEDTFVCDYKGDNGTSSVGLGDEATAHFEYAEESNVYFLSYGHNDTFTKVLLHCPKDVSFEFSFVKYDLNTKTYNLKLTTPYACPVAKNATTTVPSTETTTAMRPTGTTHESKDTTATVPTTGTTESGATSIISSTSVTIGALISVVATRVF